MAGKKRLRMTRGWFGLTLLLLLLAGGCLSSWAMVRWHEPLEGLLEQAADRVQAGDWQQAETLTGKAREKWEKRWHCAAAFADHGPMEEIDGLFAQLEVYGQNRETLSYAAVCRVLARNLGAMGDAHIPNWWNLL